MMAMSGVILALRSKNSKRTISFVRPQKAVVKFEKNSARGNGLDLWID